MFLLSLLLFRVFSFLVSFLVAMVLAFLRPLFVFRLLFVCHSWLWGLCVRRAVEKSPVRGSTGSPLGGSPQQVSGLTLSCRCLCVKFLRVCLLYLELLFLL